jgi:hypothetical protein
VFAPFHWSAWSTDRVLLFPAGGDGLRDVLLNVVLFVPLGFLLERSHGGRRSVASVLALGVLASLAIEGTQLFLLGRWTTLSDVVANGAGAALGALGSATIRRRIGEGDALMSRLFLDLPLLGLCWLLVPMLWVEALQGPLATQWSLAAAGGFAIAGAGRSNAARQRLPGGILWPVVLGWAAMSMLPALPRVPFQLVSGVTIAILACLVGDRWWRPAADRERRVEPRALTAIFVALLPWFVITWMSDPFNPAHSMHLHERILAWLAVGTSFTVVGYAVSEWRGRSSRRWPMSALLPVLLAVMIAVPLTRGRPVLVVGAAVVAAFGSLLFQVQRDHVVALRRS